MKKILSLLAVGVFMLGLSSCDNKTKEKVVNGGIISGSSSYLSNPPAASMTMLYKVAFMGAGAGGFSYSGAPALKGPARSASPDGGLGTPNADGTYTLEDNEMGMTVTLNFKKSNQTVYMDMAKLVSGNALCLYGSSGTWVAPTPLGSFNPADISVTWPKYIPSLWLRESDDLPLAWFNIDNAFSLETRLGEFSAWITGLAAFPDTVVNTVAGIVAGAQVNLSMTTTMTAGMPTDDNPQHMEGDGTITFDTGARWDVVCDLYIGANGPVRGTQTFNSTTGESGSLTFNSNGSMDGVMAMNGVSVATIRINADGTGTYTDLTTGTEYEITDAMPS